MLGKIFLFNHSKQLLHLNQFSQLLLLLDPFLLLGKFFLFNHSKTLFHFSQFSLSLLLLNPFSLSTFLLNLCQPLLLSPLFLDLRLPLFLDPILPLLLERLLSRLYLLKFSPPPLVICLLTATFLFLLGDGPSMLLTKLAV